MSQPDMATLRRMAKAREFQVWPENQIYPGDVRSYLFDYSNHRKGRIAMWTAYSSRGYRISKLYYPKRHD